MTKRRPQSPIVDLATERRDHVCLRVAGEYLEIDERTVKRRIQAGQLKAEQHGKIYRVRVASIRRFEAEQRGA